MIVHLTAEAVRDLEAIGDFIARDNPERAVSFIGELRAKCLALADLRSASHWCRVSRSTAFGGAGMAIMRSSTASRATACW